jgi:hypothetical protein
LDINSTTTNNIINTCWENVKNKVENESYPLSSEKSLVFLFAMELFRMVQNENLVIDFENQCYGEVGGISKYLDLLLYTSAEYQVAIEFKLPQKSDKGNSDKTQIREFIYRDLLRLKHLVSNGSCKIGFFLIMSCFILII